MGICTTLWRSTIGSFNQKYLKTPKTLRKRKMKKSEGIIRLKLLFTILSLLSSFYYAEFENPQNELENPRNLPKKQLCLNSINQDRVINQSMRGVSMSYSITNNNSAIHAINGNRKRTGYKISFWNCRRKLLNSETYETNKFVDVKCFIQKYKPHVMGIIESDIYSPTYMGKRSKFTTLEVRSKLKIEGYSLVFPESWNQHGQARIVAFVSDELVFKQKIEDPKYSELPNITLEIGLGKEKKTNLNLFYREWTSGITKENSQESQQKCLDLQIKYWESLYTQNKITIIMGDANLCAMTWNDEDYNASKKVLANRLQDHLLEVSSSQLVQEFTRSEMSASGLTRSCIDHVYSNSPLKCSTPELVSAGDSDHLAVFFTKYTREIRHKPQTILKRNYKHFDEVFFLKDILESKLVEKVTSCKDLDTAAATFGELFREVLDIHAPVKIFQIRTNYVPYLSQETKSLMEERKALKEEATKTGDEVLFKEYNKKRNEVKARLDPDKASYYSDKFSARNSTPSNAWKTVYNILGYNDNKAPSKIKVDEKVISNPQELANAFHKIFKDKVSKLRQKTSLNPTTDPSTRLRDWLTSRPNPLPEFKLKTINLLKLRKIMKTMKSSRSHGKDFIDSCSIKLAFPLIEEAVLHLINLSISSCSFAPGWKIQLVLPLHKKQDKLNGENYRPVSHIIEIGKIVEKVVYEQVYEHFASNALFHRNHHGFLGNHSTATALLQLHDMWLTAAENKELSAVLLLDLSAAFDIVDHKIFIKKLQDYNFSEEACNWFASYLKDRMQTVQVESRFSNPEALGQHGVPQGSILGPLIFIIFCNDFPESSEEGESILYADDDTNTVSSCDPDDLEEKVQREADRAVQWVQDNRMVCAGSKTKLMVVGTSQLRKSKLESNNRVLEINVTGANIKETKSEKLLGIVINNEMTFKDHLYGEKWRPEKGDNSPGLIPQLAQRVGILRRVVKLMPPNIFNSICQGMFNSKLLYCLQLFGNTWGIVQNDDTKRKFKAFTKHDNQRLQVLQNKVLRMKTGLPFNTPTVQLTEAAGQMSVHQLTAYTTLLTVHKTLVRGQPHYFREKLTPRYQGCTENLRMETVVPRRQRRVFLQGSYTI